MPTLSISTSYADADILYKADLDDIKNGIETFLNSTKIDSDNIQSGGVSATALASNAVTEAKVAAGAISYSKLAAAVQAMVCPSGSVIAYTGTSAPTGWLLCDGSAVSRSSYSDLFGIIGVTHGQGDGSTTFNIPDYRGRFLRHVDGSASRDPDKATRTAMNTGGNTGNNVGSVQTDTYESHSHGVTDPTHTHSLAGHASYPSTGTNPSYTNVNSVTGGGVNYASTGISINNSGGNETRPENAYVYYIIKT